MMLSVAFCFAWWETLGGKCVDGRREVAEGGCGTMLARLLRSWAAAVLPVSVERTKGARGGRPALASQKRVTWEPAGKPQEEQSDFHWCPCCFPSAAAKHASTRRDCQCHSIKNPSVGEMKPLNLEQGP